MTLRLSGASTGPNLSGEGLAVLDRAFVPHYRSPGHPETTVLGLVAEKYRAEGVPLLALHDGQALLVSGTNVAVV
jgi:dipeptidase E